MGLYEITSDKMTRLSEASLAANKVREREDLQRLLRKQISVLDRGLLVISGIAVHLK